MSPLNTPQATPRTRRRAEVRAQNPPESPQRRRVPRPGQRIYRPTPLAARQPLDPEADVRHFLEGAFNVE
jgi:hypothetical protein